MNIFKRIQASLRYREAVRQADKAHKETGERYYVMPVSGVKGQLIIMDRRNFRMLKHKHYIGKTSRIKHLEEECFYCTAYRNGSGELTPAEKEQRRELYFSWVKAIGKMKKK